MKNEVTNELNRVALKFALVTLLLLGVMGWAATARGQQTQPPSQTSTQTPAPTSPPTSSQKKGQAQAKTDPATSNLNAYVARVKAQNAEEHPTSGSIWSDSGRFTRMSSDVRAMRPHDLINVVINESLTASTDGTVKNSRSSSANSGISGLLGTLHAGNAMQNLITQNSASALNAAGDSETSSSLTTSLGGEVVDVLPNGMLVIEAARQVEFNQQTQTIILRGLVRPEDISQQNQILSTSISSLELEVKGKGIINDYTHRQNALVRFIQKLLVF